MNVTLEKNNDLEGRIIVKIDEADYADKVKQELKEIGKTRQIPGFRKGHVEMAQLQKRFGNEVKMHVLNDLAVDNTINYIRENKLDILGQPIPEERESKIDLADKDFTFVYEVGFAPEVNMVINKDVHLPFYTIEVSEEMMNQQIESMRQQAADQVPSDTYADRALVKGVIRQLNEDGSVKDGGIVVEEGILAPFLFKNEEEAKKFEGTKAGDKVVFDAYATCNGEEAELASMLHINRDEVEKARGNFEIEIKEFIVAKPAELNQAFYDKVFGPDKVHNEEEFKAAVKKMIEEALAPNSRQFFTRTVEDYLMDTYAKNMTLPEAFIVKLIKRENPDLTEEGAADSMKHSIPGIKWEIVESKAAEIMDVKVTEDDLKTFARMVAMQQLQQYGLAQMADQMADYYAENLLKDEKTRNQIARQAYTGNLMSAIHDAVTLDEKTVSMDEFRAMVDDLNAKVDPAEKVDEADA